ncbi:MAG: hypothetical protein ABH851_09280 [Methanobacteriota archaeon]
MARCPFCESEVSLDTVKTEKKGAGILKQEILYSCPRCDKILGFSRGKFG